MNICISSQQLVANSHFTFRRDFEMDKRQESLVPHDISKFKKKFSEAIHKAGGQKAVCARAGIDASRVSKFINSKSGLGMTAGLAVLDALGAKIVFPGEEEEATTRDIVFTTPRIVGVEQYKDVEARAHPKDENYLAVPMVEESVAAGPGKSVEDNQVKDWVVVYRFDPAIRHTSNLVAVRIGQKEMSMIPTMHPGDIVLVDRSDKRPDPAGKIVLASEPVEVGEKPRAMIKRVSAHHEKGDLLLIFSSDNPDQNTYHPRPYYLNQDYGGDIERAITGRVVWAWSDMTKK